LRYLLDTNVVSELRKGPLRAAKVASWAESVDAADLGLSVLVVGEIRQGIETLRRRGDGPQAEVFAAWLERLKLEFRDRVLPVDSAVAERWGELRAETALPPVDGLMAATALEHDLVFVTRDVAAVAATGVRVLDPWTA
jgi:toxin FitB